MLCIDSAASISSGFCIKISSALHLFVRNPSLESCLRCFLLTLTFPSATWSCIPIVIGSKRHTRTSKFEKLGSVLCLACRDWNLFNTHWNTISFCVKIKNKNLGSV
jgi:hypothetical protein